MNRYRHGARHVMSILSGVLLFVAALTAAPIPAAAQTLRPQTLIEIGAVVQGRIVDDQGRGVGGVPVVALPSRMSAVTDPDGTYRIAYVPRGPTLVVPLAPSDGQFFLPPAHFVWVRESTSRDLNFIRSAAAPQMLLVGGRILDREGHGLVGVRVMCGRIPTATQTGGWYACPPQRAATPVVVEPRPLTPMHVAPPSYAFDTPRTVVDADFVLTPVMTPLRGRIVNAQQQGIPGVAVQVQVRTRTAPAPITHTVVTDANGRFVIEVPHGARVEVIPQMRGLIPERRALTASDRMPEAFFRQLPR